MNFEGMTKMRDKPRTFSAGRMSKTARPSKSGGCFGRREMPTFGRA